MGAAPDADAGDISSPGAAASRASARGGGVYQVGGVPVEFPYKPYGTQLAFMGRVIATLDRARRQGRAHALLESPTGTGKSLSLLCSALAWQRHFPLRTPPSPPNDPLLNGGGFLPDDTQQPPGGSTEKAAKKKKPVPTIYYASRTHSQISQVIREYRKTTYRVPMAILASRKHYCVNKYVCNSDNIDEQCKALLYDKVQGCPESKNTQKLKNHPSLVSGGCYEVYDIEDLVRVGRKVKGCPYFAAQIMAEYAQLVFCPYNYLISPVVRRAMGIDISGSIVILDEAHNIEDMARDAGSVDVDEELLISLQTELANLTTTESIAMIYQPLHDIIQGLISWIADRKDNLQNHEFEHHSSYWTGERAMKELQCAGLTPQYFPMLQECAAKAVKAASDTESDGDHLSGGAALTLESLFSSLSYFFAGNGRHFYDYQLALQRFVKREGSAVVRWKCMMSLWCLSPAVVFQEIANITLSVILTSGTLSPIGSFASELGVQFEACMEAPHVINADSQVFATVLSSGPTKHRLNASYKTADAYSFQDELGASLEEICRIVPGGALVFFPSYKLLDKLQARWSQTGQWTRLNAQKPVFVEPRGSNEELEPILKGYYDAIIGKAPLRKARGGPKQVVKNRVTKNSLLEPAKEGAAFLAVCRGKVSEGIDFSDDNARVVVIIGIPFPNVNDVQVKLKKRYNDEYKSSKQLLSGSEWYCHQAFRALNQAAGRCIRHRFDYGGIILIDERYREERNLVHISKWLRNSIKHYDSFMETMDQLQKFFQNAEEQIRIKTHDMSTKGALDSDVPPCLSDKRKLPWPEPNFSNHSVLQRNQKVKTERYNGRAVNIDSVAVDHKKLVKSPISSEVKKITSKSLTSAVKQSPYESKSPAEFQLPHLCKVQSHLEGQVDTGANYGVKINFINLEENDDAEPQYAKLTILEPLENKTPQSILVEQTPADDLVASSSDHSEGNTSAKISNDGGQNVDVPVLLSTVNGNLSCCISTSAASPDRLANGGCHAEHESLLNRSVNSHCKRKRRLSSPLSCCTYTEDFNFPGKSFCQADHAVSTVSGYLKGTLGPCCQNMKMSKRENVHLERDHNTIDFSSNKSMQTKLFICCFRCKKALGLEEDGFLVTGSLSSYSKVYLAYLLKHGPTSTGLLPDDFSASAAVKVKAVVCDVSSLDHKIFDRCSGEGTAHPGVWSEKDGCVFKAVTCPFCSPNNACVTTLGVQVLATDNSNLHLLNKVVLFADSLDIDHDPSESQDKVATSAPRSSPPVIDLESFAYKPLNKDPVLLSSKRSKLRLPKRDQTYNGQPK